MCYCGDLYCWSCGPAQGNIRCWICGKWSADGGCDNPKECEKKFEEQYPQEEEEKANAN